MATVKKPDECTTIDEVRAEIDRVDRAIVQAIAQRAEYVKAVLRFKKTAEEVRAPARAAAVLAQRRQWAVELGLDPDVIEAIYRGLIAYFIDQEMKALEQGPSPQP